MPVAVDFAPITDLIWPHVIKRGTVLDKLRPVREEIDRRIDALYDFEGSPATARAPKVYELSLETMTLKKWPTN